MSETRKETAVILVERDVARDIYTFQCTREVLPNLMDVIERGAELLNRDGVEVSIAFELVTQEPKYTPLREHVDTMEALWGKP